MQLILNLLTGISVFLSKALINRYKLIIITIGGSVGKTGTKYVVGDALDYKVPTIYQKGSYNQPFSIPFALFGLNYPTSPKNLFSWAKVYAKMLSLIFHGYKYKAAVLEIGTDRPGDIIQTTKWLKSDVAILTAIKQEHMQNFTDLDQVAREEFGIFKNAKLKFASGDSVSSEFIKKYGDPNLKLYGFGKKDAHFNPQTSQLSIKLNASEIKIKSAKPAQYLNQPLIVAALVANQVFNFSPEDVQSALSLVNFPAGRMNTFAGINSSTIIDDTYNASPEAYAEALNLIYKLSAKRRILVLGNMNEFGNHAKQAHSDLAKLIKPSDQDIIVTIGEDAGRHLFAELQHRGVTNLIKFNDPWSVGSFLKETIKAGDLVFLKGSQNGVFLEEAIKPILKNKKDTNKLCRQSSEWMDIKLKFKDSLK